MFAWFLGRNHTNISAIGVWSETGVLRSVDFPPLSPSESVSEQVRAFPGPDLFANLLPFFSESPCL